jgi:tellurite resistance protein
MELTEVTYDGIKHLIAEERFEENKCFVTFKVEGELYEGEAFLRKDGTDGTERVKTMVRNSLIGRLRSAVTRTISRVVGGGMVGHTATMVGSEVVRQQTSGTVYSRKEKEEAVVKAFRETAKSNFYFDEERKDWRIARMLAEFERRLRQSPLEKAYDKKTLARMLIEMAKADGAIAQEEKEFFQSFLSAETGSFAELMRAQPLSRVECEEVTSVTMKENVLMITAAVAMADHDFSAVEKQKLSSYGEMMGLDEKTINNMIKAAQDYTIEQAILNGEDFSREEIYAFADKIGMDKSEAERAQVRLNKRITN